MERPTCRGLWALVTVGCRCWTGGGFKSVAFHFVCTNVFTSERTKRFAQFRTVLLSDCRFVDDTQDYSVVGTDHVAVNRIQLVAQWDQVQDWRALRPHRCTWWHGRGGELDLHTQPEPRERRRIAGLVGIPMRSLCRTRRHAMRLHVVESSRFCNDCVRKIRRVGG